MNIEEAKDLVSFEGKSPNGIVVATRLCEFPSLVRVHVLIEALKVIFENYKDVERIERNIAHALYCISFHVQANMEVAHSNNVEVDEKFDEEILIVYMLVESIFENEWLLG